MKKLKKYDLFFGITTAWDVFFAALSLATAHIGGVIFFGALGLFQLCMWLYTRHNLKEMGE